MRRQLFVAAPEIPPAVGRCRPEVVAKIMSGAVQDKKQQFRRLGGIECRGTTSGRSRRSMARDDQVV